MQKIALQKFYISQEPEKKNLFMNLYMVIVTESEIAKVAEKINRSSSCVKVVIIVIFIWHFVYVSSFCKHSQYPNTLDKRM